MTELATFRFRPRYRGIAWSALGVGALVGVLGVIIPAIGLVVAGAVGIALGTTYLASPTWRLRVTVDDLALEVVGRFRLPWAEVTRVLASPTTRTCFVDGGTPARSLLVPGDGAPAPYSFDDRGALYDAIMARVPSELVRELALLTDPATPS